MGFSILEDGPRVRIIAEHPDDQTGLYKAYLQGAAGRVLMGTLMPEQGKLRIARTFSIDSLRRDGVWPLESVEIVLSFPAPPTKTDIPNGWSRVENLPSLMSDGILKQCANLIKNALVHHQSNGFLIAIPFYGAFEFAPLFCFAVVETMEGRDYAIFSFDEKGIPKFPHKSK
jgi:hypothetical protein